MSEVCVTHPNSGDQTPRAARDDETAVGASPDEPMSARVAQLETALEAANLHIERMSVRMARLEERISRGWLRSKLSQKMMVFDQYAPRTLKTPPVYASAVPPEPAPRIAIVTPSFNQGHFLGATIESVLGQGYPNLAYHVQDGGSTDKTPSVLKRFGPALTSASAPDGGQAKAINLGFSTVESDIMSYLNSDDLLTPGTLAYVARFFSENPDVDIVYGHRIVIDVDGRETGRVVLPPHDPEALKWFDYVPQETLFWRRHVWTKLGGIDESFQFAMDRDFILRAQAARMTFRRLPLFLGCFRVHSRQKTTAASDTGAREMAILRRRMIGHVPSDREVRRHMRPYLRRHVIAHRLYKLRVLKY
jgi:hypothetical protein